MKHHFLPIGLLWMLQQAAGNTDDGLTLGEVVRHIPHDWTAFVVYVLLFGAVGFVWVTGRSPS